MRTWANIGQAQHPCPSPRASVLDPTKSSAPLGAGGMGEVYRARDTRLARDVAIKVLPRELARDPQRRQRLEREAQAISALSHPNVCALFDVGRAELPGGPIDFLVMELVEGETLASRLERGPLPLAQVVCARRADRRGARRRPRPQHRPPRPQARQRHAHALGREAPRLRPRARTGTAARSPSSPQSGMTDALPMPLTQEGTVVGTWPYLVARSSSAAGPPTRAATSSRSARVLYEMLTARRAFPGATLAEVHAAILGESVPDPRAHAKALPAPLVAVVRKCLEKDPRARWQNADDVALALRLVGDAPTAPRRGRPLDGAPASGSRSRWRSGSWPRRPTASLLLRRSAPEAEPLRFVVQPPRGALLPRSTMGLPVAVSPDGRRVAFVASTGGEQGGLWLWSAEDGESRRLEGTDGGVGAFFSPDGRDIAFFADDELRRIPGAAVPRRASRARLGTRGHAGARTGRSSTRAGSGPRRGFGRCPPTGGEPRRLQRRRRTGRPARLPLRSCPTAEHYLFLKGGMGGEVGSARSVSPRSRGASPTASPACDSAPAYSGTGHVALRPPRRARGPAFRRQGAPAGG